jgi:hypothetical protein
MINDVSSLWYSYLVWVVISAIVLWVLARACARRSLHATVTWLAALTTLVCLGLLVYSFIGPPGPPHTPVPLLLARRGPPLLVSFLIWPFLACMAVAQVFRGKMPRTARWLAFGCGPFLACVGPFAIVFAGCGLARVCF